MGSILFLKPTLAKLVLTILSFLFIIVFFNLCSPLEFETFGDGSAMGRHINYNCGIISAGIYNVFGSAWNHPSTISYWYIYLPFAYLLSCVLMRAIESARKIEK